eukprot:CAMPEP_0182419070 /NCGR_PEP_ID=MMETSP1167-20130531/3467_1 /TAXON_ID=2988 /ORGANISM="Mallomonas Sp, Strain CCMP3275" /LENGTH=435 /DNA_ID=CAMNT_0024593677 /DNA_START=75 /DNA_END=1382 /DNA_ORIENTATION=-
MTSKLALRVGVFGGGVVGGGLCELVQKYMVTKFPAMGVNIQIVKVCVRDLSKPRTFKMQEGISFTTNYDDILNDSTINCVVELMGGVTDAKDVVYRAIAADKHVITANKALIASYIGEIQSLLEAHPAVQFSYEAAVCGGIPIIHTLQSAYLGDSITKVMGIMNGTTNFMLCKMEDEGAAYDDVLKEAQALGFAEANPTADVDGFDVQAKIALLAKLSYGQNIIASSIPTQGITAVTSADFHFSTLLKSTIKLVGVAARNPDNSIAVFVAPMMVPTSSPLSTAKGPGNMVVVECENMTSSTYAGPGAGRFPTANSVLSDLTRLSLGQSCPPFPLKNSVSINNDYSSRFYMRVSCQDKVGVLKLVGEAAEKSEVSIFSLLQDTPSLSLSSSPSSSNSVIDFVLTTNPTMQSKMKQFADVVSSLPMVTKPPLFMPLL